MFLELHIVQNFAPSNLNRDDTNAPKDCEFGGYRRARISSQCIKRSIRTAFRDHNLIDDDHRGLRTKRLAGELAKRLRASGTSDEIQGVADAAVQGLGLSFAKGKKEDAEKKTEYLLFLGEREVAQLADTCRTYWDQLSSVATSAGSLPNDVKTALQRILDGGKAADVALFGRMLADLPGHNIHAACQVAHAISTNRVSMEFDFYTAIDDRNPADTAGAGMMGTVEFNSACFYRYSNLDLDQLLHNLGGDEELTRATLTAYLQATVAAIPTGKQNSMAAQNPPSFVMAVLRDGGRWSLANAFLKPVAPNDEGDLTANSIRALDAYWGKLATVYSDDDVTGAWCISLEADGLSNLCERRVGTLRDLIAGVSRSAAFTSANGAYA